MTEEKIIPELRHKEYQSCEAVGKTIATYRNQRGLTQAKLATLIQVSQARVAEIESGKNALTLITLLRLAEALEVQPDKILMDALTGNV